MDVDALGLSLSAFARNLKDDIAELIDARMLALRESMGLRLETRGRKKKVARTKGLLIFAIRRTHMNTVPLPHCSYPVLIF
jgi:hypothetical protein